MFVGCSHCGVCIVVLYISVLSALVIFYSTVDSIRSVRLYSLCGLIMFVAPSMMSIDFLLTLFLFCSLSG